MDFNTATMGDVADGTPCAFRSTRGKDGRERSCKNQAVDGSTFCNHHSGERRRCPHFPEHLVDSAKFERHVAKCARRLAALQADLPQFQTSGYCSAKGFWNEYWQARGGVKGSEQGEKTYCVQEMENGGVVLSEVPDARVEAVIRVLLKAVASCTRIRELVIETSKSPHIISHSTAFAKIAWEKRQTDVLSVAADEVGSSSSVKHLFQTSVLGSWITQMTFDSTLLSVCPCFFFFFCYLFFSAQ